MTPSPLSEWENFYVIVGSAAAGLTGLTFVVISITAEAQRQIVAGVRAFVTPTIVHFTVVLVLAAFLSAPHQGPLTLSVGFSSGGALGLLYVGSIVRGMHSVRQHYVPVAEDWVWHALVPGLAYACLLTMGLLVGRDLAGSLYGAAATSVALLLAGIHNAWDVAVWNSTHRAGRPRQD
ncbi:MAG: hypothetical protein JO005_11585 [Gammaproteobacteria bacterium]|nr:hypothetical protein [Gammaproteobacteria bacterium]